MRLQPTTRAPINPMMTAPSEREHRKHDKHARDDTRVPKRSAVELIKAVRRDADREQEGGKRR